MLVALEGDQTRIASLAGFDWMQGECVLSLPPRTSRVWRVHPVGDPPTVSLALDGGYPIEGEAV